MSPLFSRVAFGLFVRRQNARNFSIKTPLRINYIRGDGTEINVTPPRYNWVKFKDILHLHVFLWTAPLVALITYVNIRIGPATLKPIPEGYVPKEYECHQHPIARWMSKNFYQERQKTYEAYLHTIWQQDKERKQIMLKEEVKRLMKQDGDYAAYYYVPVPAKYHRLSDYHTRHREAEMGQSLE